MRGSVAARVCSISAQRRAQRRAQNAPPHNITIHILHNRTFRKSDDAILIKPGHTQALKGMDQAELSRGHPESPHRAPLRTQRQRKHRCGCMPLQPSDVAPSDETCGTRAGAFSAGDGSLPNRYLNFKHMGCTPQHLCSAESTHSMRGLATSAKGLQRIQSRDLQVPAGTKCIVPQTVTHNVTAFSLCV